MLLDPRNAPSWDQAPWPAAPRWYVVASLPRTGSTLLCNALWDTGRVGAPKEYLNPMQRRDWGLRAGRWALWGVRGPALALLGRAPWSDADLEAHLAELTRLRAGGGWFGLKIHAHHHQRLGAQAPLASRLQQARWVFLTRDDQLGQAISWVRARQTGRWAHWQKGLLPPIYSRRAIAGALAQIREGEAYWERALEGQPVLRLRYEQLTQDLGACVQQVFDHLGLEQPAPSPSASLQRQADGLNQRWRERYLAGA